MALVIVAHEPDCPPRNRTTLGGHDDAAKRVSDIYQGHRTGNDRAIGSWFAARLGDGTSDGVLYDRRRDAVRHQHHNEQQYIFVNIRPCGLTICQAASLLRFHRQAYQNGYRLADPEHRAGGRELITRLGLEDQQRHQRALDQRIWIPPRSPRR